MPPRPLHMRGCSPATCRAGERADAAPCTRSPPRSTARLPGERPYTRVGASACATSLGRTLRWHPAHCTCSAPALHASMQVHMPKAHHAHAGTVRHCGPQNSERGFSIGEARHDSQLAPWVVLECLVINFAAPMHVRHRKFCLKPFPTPPLKHVRATAAEANIEAVAPAPRREHFPRTFSARKL